jgi:hypothetical protein
LGLREAIRKKQGLTAVVACVIIAVAMVAIFVQARDGGFASPDDVYYTKDDGKTFYPDTADKLMVPDASGNPNVRAHLIEVNGKQVVGYMSRMTPEALKTIQEAQEARKAGRPVDGRKLSAIAQNGVEYKKPGDAKWIPSSDVQAVTKIRSLQRPGEGNVASNGKG